MLLAYRIGYFLVAALFLVNIVSTEYVGSVPAVIVVLKVAAALVLCASLVLVVAFSKVHVNVFWMTILVWQGLFLWYVWLSPGAPLAALVRDRVLAGALFVVFSAWFYSLPVVRILCQRRQR